MSTLSFSTPRRSLIVPTGAAGSGKSTLLNQVADALSDPRFRYGNDDVRRDFYGGVFSSDTSDAVARQARALTYDRLITGLPCALDSTHNGKTSRALVLEMAEAALARPVALLCTMSFSQVWKRNISRDPALRVPRSIVFDMVKNVRALTPKLLKAEGFSAVYCFDANVTDLTIDFTD
jgi:predicted kinase